MPSILPDPDLLERACRGLSVIRTGRPALDCLVELAAELGGVHRDRLQALDLARIDERRRLGARSLDALAGAALGSAPPCAKIHSEPLSSIVDRVANWCAALHDPIAARLTVEEVALAETHIAQLLEGYAALRQDIARGDSRLPETTALVPWGFAGLDFVLRRREWTAVPAPDRMGAPAAATVVVVQV